MTDLLAVKTLDEFPSYFQAMGLSTTEQQIDHLIEATGVRAMRGSGTEKPDVTLALLEESALLGYWKDLK